MKVKLLKNIKYNKQYHKVGEVIQVNKDDIEEFIEKEVVNVAEIDFIEETEEIEKVDATEQSTTEENEDGNAIDYTLMTKAEIGELLSEKGIEYNSRNAKDNLINLLLGSD